MTALLKGSNSLELFAGNKAGRKAIFYLIEFLFGGSLSEDPKDPDEERLRGIRDETEKQHPQLNDMCKNFGNSKF
jgi:hypothetical protein